MPNIPAQTELLQHSVSTRAPEHVTLSRQGRPDEDLILTGVALYARTEGDNEIEALTLIGNGQVAELGADHLYARFDLEPGAVPEIVWYELA